MLQAIDAGDALAANQTLPIVDHELRKLAGTQLAEEKPGHTLPPTAMIDASHGEDAK
jgi:hypothetical protein